MRISHIKGYEQEGWLDFRRAQPRLWTPLREDFKREHKIELPPRDELSAFGDPDEVRIWLTPLTLTLNFTSGEWIQYKIEPGFMTDFGSVPKRARSFLDNDDLNFLVAYIIHDINQVLHFLSFKDTHRLFKQMVKRSNAKWFERMIANIGVRSRRAKKLYNKDRRVMREWNSRFVQCIRSGVGGIR